MIRSRLDYLRAAGALTAGLLAFGFADAAPVPLDAPLLQKPLRGLQRPVATKALPAPADVTVKPTAGGAQINWTITTGNASHLVLRGSPPAEPALATLPPGQNSFIDKGASTPTSYQVVAVMNDGRRAFSPSVSFTPPMAVVSGKSRLLALPAGLAVKDGQMPAMSRTAAALEARNAAQNAPPPTPMTVSAVRPANTLNNPVSFLVRSGDALVIQGTGLDGLSGLVLHYAVQTNGVWAVNTQALRTYPVTPTRVTPDRIDFIVPEIPPIGPGAPMVAVLTKGSQTVTSKEVLIHGPTPTARRIQSVAQHWVRAGGRIKITGTGFDDVPGPGGYNGVIGGYFGQSAPDSTTNRRIGIMNRSANYVELLTPPDCDQQGILMLNAPRPGGGSDDLITGDQPIIVGCVRDTPSGYIVGSESTGNGMVTVAPGSRITIRGSGLKAVTRVVDSFGNVYPFTYAFVGPIGTGFEMLSVTLPQTPGFNMQFRLENPLTDPVMPGMVNGIARIPAPPTWNNLGPAWAEAGQKITITGHNLSYGSRPTVTVGGVPAQVLTYSELRIEARIGAGTTSGPVVVQAEGGSVTLSGPLTYGYNSTHPGFFIVSGPSVVQAIQWPATPPAFGGLLTVTGQNLARLGGICVHVPGYPAPTIFRRSDAGGYAPSNTEMQVPMQFDGYTLARATGSVIQMYAPTLPPGDYAPTDFACQPGSTSLAWPY